MESILASIGLSNPDELLLILKTMLRIVLIVFIALVLMNLSRRLISYFKMYLKQQAAFENAEEVKRIDTLARVVRYIATLLISLVCGVEVLHELGISIAPILAAAGIVGVAVGFGAQHLIKDYFTGFFILLENQIRQGDVVEAGGKSGLVEEVTLRYIKMRDYSGNVHYVPNGIIDAVTNMSREFAHAVIDIAVAYKEDVASVMQVMTEVGDQLRNQAEFKHKILGDMEMAGVENLADSSVVIRCRFKVLPLEQWGVRREYLKNIKHAFDTRGIEIPFPQLSISPRKA
ncbi:MAG: mechanosensitive ion channel family protein [Pseudomonadota bacterium]